MRRKSHTLRNTTISIFVLLLLFVGGGIAYVYLSGDSYNAQPAEQPGPLPPPSGVLKPRKPSPNAPESAAIESLLSPVKAGSNSSFTVSTLPGSICKIEVTYKNKKSADSGLTPKKANEYGRATWTWSVPSSTPVGTWPVKVTCAYNKKSAVVIGDLKVTK